MRTLRISSWFAFGMFVLACAALYLDTLGGHLSRWSADLGLAVLYPILAAIAAAFCTLPFHLRIRRARGPVESLVFTVPLGLGLAYLPLMVGVVGVAHGRIGEVGLEILVAAALFGLPFVLGEVAVRLASFPSLTRRLSTSAPEDAHLGVCQKVR
jgi:hypothetical protein